MIRLDTDGLAAPAAVAAAFEATRRCREMRIMPRWIEAAKQDELAPGDRLCRTIEGASVALFNVEGKLHAIRNVCPHAGMPLDGGDLQGTIITCPFHGYTYDIASGRNVDFADDVPVDVLPVRVEAGNVEVDADALSPSP